jgi:hypothetical protein
MIGAVATVTFLAGCSTIQSSAETRRTIMESQFFRDSSLFFPEDSVADARCAPPPLTSRQRAALEADLNRQLATVRKLAEAPVMAELFGELMPIPRRTRVVLTNFNAPEASTAEDGEIAHRRPRGQGAAALCAGNAVSDRDRHRSRQERPPLLRSLHCRRGVLAINTFLAARARARDTEGHSLLGDAMASTRQGANNDDTMDLFGLSERRRDLSGLDVRYDSEMLFLIAHEVGHLALGHFGRGQRSSSSRRPRTTAPHGGPRRLPRTSTPLRWSRSEPRQRPE